MKRKVIFKDSARNRVVFECEVINGRFSASGEYCGAAGQCFDSVKPDGEQQTELINIWREYHLNDMHAGTAKQEEFTKGLNYDQVLIKLTSIRRSDLSPSFLSYSELSHDLSRWNNELKTIDNWFKTASLSEEDRERAKYYKETREKYQVNAFEIEELLNSTLLYDEDPRDPDKLYLYGSAWLSRALPENFEDHLNDLIEQIEFEEEAKQDRKITDSEEDRELFNDFGEPETAHALAIVFELSVNEIDEISEGNGHRWTIQGVDYLAGTDEDMKEELTENIKNAVWAFNASFLSSFCDLGSQVFEVLSEKCEGANDAILSLIEKSGGLESFVEDAESADGRAHFLNTWDGSEIETSLNGVDYYAYRN